MDFLQDKLFDLVDENELLNETEFADPALVADVFATKLISPIEFPTKFCPEPIDICSDPVTLADFGIVPDCLPHSPTLDANVVPQAQWEAVVEESNSDPKSEVVEVPSPTTTLSPDSPVSQTKGSKRRKSSSTVPDEDLNEEQLAKRIKRRQRNKESAQQSRLRKKQFMEDLGRQATALTQQNTALQTQVREILVENELLKRLLQENGITPPAVRPHPTLPFGL
eukprot:c4414_g1_i1.p1 GENE.c4414_g1_i1~~c4414_g1_i1.p1  ORF type:complete len:224 (+),score=47.61 c4414_g1_i1:101-772(+)